jgi:hypothetical protein
VDVVLALLLGTVLASFPFLQRFLRGEGGFLQKAPLKTIFRLQRRKKRGIIAMEIDSEKGNGI